MRTLCQHIQTRHRRCAHALSQHSIGSRSPSGWHAMPVPQPLPGQRSPCSGCQTLSPPSSARPPSGRGLLARREAALLEEVFLSERLLMPSLPGCPSTSLRCCSVCCLSHCLSRLLSLPFSTLSTVHLLTQRFTLPYLVAHPVGIRGVSSPTNLTCTLSFAQGRHGAGLLSSWR